MTFTKERLTELSRRENVGAILGEEIAELARIALASLEAEAVAYIIQDSDARGRGEKGILRYFANISDEDINEYEITVTPLYAAPPAPVSVPDYPETLPCPVMLEPGLRFGKGVKTHTVLEALKRRAEYYAELEVMTPEQRVEHDAGMKEFAAMLQGAEPVTTAGKLPFEQWLSQQTGTIDVECGCVMTEVFFHWLRVAYEAGNYPVIPDDWVACSERLPENKPGSYEYLVFEGLNNRVQHDYWNVPDAGDDCQFTPFWNHYDRYVTHWMALPAAPQQEA
ncbi:DUF551 domain-containing protein [Enterobacter roggenkampii]|uniref:DUF551 domain-containing protein n=1 Tax=Enterobacter roggenkampii TaxID=1812935 RepID=UPI0032B01CEE